MKRSMMQVYVKDSLKAVELYQKAFDAKLIHEVRNADNTFLHAELDIGGQIVAISEADGQAITGNTMQFCFHYGEGNEGSVKKAYRILKDGSEIIHPIGESFFSPCMAAFIDQFGVNWCLFV